MDVDEEVEGVLGGGVQEPRTLSFDDLDVGSAAAGKPQPSTQPQPPPSTITNLINRHAVINSGSFIIYQTRDHNFACGAANREDGAMNSR